MAIIQVDATGLPYLLQTNRCGYCSNDNYWSGVWIVAIVKDSTGKELARAASVDTSVDMQTNSVLVSFDAGEQPDWQTIEIYIAKGCCTAIPTSDEYIIKHIATVAREPGDPDRAAYTIAISFKTT